MRTPFRLPHLAVWVYLLTLPVTPDLTGTEAPGWRVLIANDTCPDVTWGFTEEETRQAFADLLGSHLDEMNRTDAWAKENRDHFNLATTQEALDFVARYPARKEELIRRIREGRITVSPFLCNTLWGFQSAEGVLRSLYPARRLERAWGIRIDVAEHIEMPSLPWGMAPLLAGSGIRWLVNPFYDYDSTFAALRNPPLFRWQGPDGSELRVALDAWACQKGSYAQGALLLKHPELLRREWLPHYEALGAAYPLRLALASGTHSDISPASGKQTRGFADAVAAFNAQGPPDIRLENSTFTRFCDEVDAAEGRAAFLPAVHGCFGHSWDLWPVSLANLASRMRQEERAFLAAESLVALASEAEAELGEKTRQDRERAEWYWTMLADHAWNGTDPANKRHNARLRRDWCAGLGRLAEELTRQAWDALGATTDRYSLTVFNPLSYSCDRLVSYRVAEGVVGVHQGARAVAAQIRDTEGRRELVFVAESLPAYGFRQFELLTDAQATPATSVEPVVHALELDGDYYRVAVDAATGEIRSLVHKALGEVFVGSAQGGGLGRIFAFRAGEHRLTDVQVVKGDDGPIGGSLRVTGRIGEIRVTNEITLYRKLDRIDLDYRVYVPVATNEHRLCAGFPWSCGRRDLRVETPGAVVRPAPAPEGDLLPGGDSRRMAVQGFVDAAPPDRPGLTVVSPDAFMLRVQDEGVVFELLGNDQNWKEVCQDQDGESKFRFRFTLRAHAPGYENAGTIAWSRSVLASLPSFRGRVPARWLERDHLAVDPARAVVTCLKPAEDSGDWAIRLWETGGQSLAVPLRAPTRRGLATTDLLERERGESGPAGTPIPVRGHGFAGVRLQR